ncbi:MAG: glycoside hydrolase family 97 protein [Woeseiaceae bacterium]|nr:glycoside hydrolase family 97 protein [Woeseiaceae bacterium]
MGENNKNHSKSLVLLLLSSMLAAPAFGANLESGRTCFSPDRRIQFRLETDQAGTPRYSVKYGDEVVVAPSRLGLRFRGSPAMEDGMAIVAEVTGSRNETWEQPWGERRRVVDQRNACEWRLGGFGSTPSLRVEVRVFNDGVGFRYTVPEQDDYEDLQIVDELTEFAIDPEATAWWIPGRGWNRYEFIHRETPAGDIVLAHTPMTVRLASGTHLSFHEAALVDYPAYVLDQRRAGVFQTNLTPWSNGIRAYKSTPFSTPWRTIQISPDAVGLLNSDLILNLNEPNALGDVSWVEPGKYVGIWWTMHLGESTWGSGPTHGATTDEARRYIDFAAENGFSGVLVEGWNIGWDGDWFASGAGFSFTESYPDFDIEEVADYALERGVRLVGHHETSGHITNYEAQLDDAFDFYESLGVRQVKTGYVADGGQLERVDDDGVTHYEWHDGQFAVNHYLRVTVEAAERQISINTHEPIKATGLRRTYPNWITREGARGQEFNAWWDPPNPPNHTATLPYTRLLGGPMDFTPGIFDLTFQGEDSPQRVQSTLMKQLALYVTMYSPIQMAADLPENYGLYPDAFQFIVDVPADWEQSIALAGEVGDYVVYARQERDGEDWYVGAVTNEDARSITLGFDFLDDDRRYTATIYRDGDEADWQTNPYDYVIETLSVDKYTQYELTLAAGGGAAIRISPAD